MCRALQTAGLIESTVDIGYFTAEDLAHIAQTENIEEGRNIWQKRRHEYEHYARLQAPPFLGKAPAQEANPKRPSTKKNGQTEQPEEAISGTVITGKGCVPGQSIGTAGINSRAKSKKSFGLKRKKKPARSGTSRDSCYIFLLSTA